jgi:hypothetical protein
VTAAVAREQRLLKIIPPDYRRVLLEAPRGAVRNKIWAADVYECSRVHVFLWWLTSLPFRLAVHRLGKHAQSEPKLDINGMDGHHSHNGLSKGLE